MQCSRHVLLTCVLAAGLLAACSARDENRASQEARRQFHLVMEGKLRQLDRGIGSLATSPADSSSLEVLKQQQRTLQSQLDDMAAASDESWLSLKESLEVDYRDLRDQYAVFDRRNSTTSARAEADTLGTSGGVQTN